MLGMLGEITLVIWSLKSGRNRYGEYALPKRVHLSRLFVKFGLINMGHGWTQIAQIFSALATGHSLVILTGVCQKEKLTKAKKHNTYFLFVTDGITWRQRLNDLRKIIKFQNDGYIQKIYTLSMIDEMKDDLKILKTEFGL